jgi:mannosyltransferase OCH1-like enzyme
MQANRQMVQDHFPWFLETYDKLPGNIMRADASRCGSMML